MWHTKFGSDRSTHLGGDADKHTHTHTHTLYFIYIHQADKSICTTPNIHVEIVPFIRLAVEMNGHIHIHIHIHIQDDFVWISMNMMDISKT